LFRHVHGVAGSTILGNGAVALILDVSALVGLTAATHPGATGFAHASIQGDKQCSSI
jgi:chemotaxis protein histidine kinase CheA